MLSGGLFISKHKPETRNHTGKDVPPNSRARGLLETIAFATMGRQTA